MRTAFCSGCMRMEPVDANWVALWIDSDGDLLMTSPERGGSLDFERPGTVFACGQGSALVLTERYLHRANFQVAHTAEVEIAEAAYAPNTDTFTELT